ncbi:BRCT domain-containing protein [Salinisphaera orenii]|uniref:NAD-dependent DNA ligase n=1 Tax=Salinisphaera orenii YIM 95161 TaxID=1051139 RepID=A0A423Q9Z5_9GAMM|nr:BRCT domain-containing protein [Salinisphaera halophila]ROO37220.1 NAD-dependent DNA ligase [Salinisphaera halophila YIM 95161]
MDMFVQFNRKSIDDRQMDTLIGLSKGLVADRQINQAEAEFLQNWLIQNRQATENPVIGNLLSKISVMLEDGVLDAEESAELLETLYQISGKPSEFGELARAAALPINDPAPQIAFEGSTFVFTGTCALGTRKDCQKAVEHLGGHNIANVTKKLNYLVLGSYVTDSWAHETFGRKIEKAMDYRDLGVPLAIITEEHWAKCGGLA